MNTPSTRYAFVFAGLLCAGMALLGFELGNAALKIKAHERTVHVKGLAEREVEADTVIWPLSFQVSSNDLDSLYKAIVDNNAAITEFLAEYRLDDQAVPSIPGVIDQHANNYRDLDKVAFRFTAAASQTVYSTDIEDVRRAMANTISLGDKGIILTGTYAQFLFTGLNDIKPDMIAESTRNARAVAQKFAADSSSQLGKIRSARQGQFSIENRDSTTPHIKKVRVVSTIEYYLSD